MTKRRHCRIIYTNLIDDVRFFLLMFDLEEELKTLRKHDLTALQLLLWIYLRTHPLDVTQIAIDFNLSEKRIRKNLRTLSRKGFITYEDQYTKKLNKTDQYKQFVNGKRWKKFRQKHLGEECEFCHRRRFLQLHHFTYKRGLLDPNSVITLCKTCHNEVHKVQKEKNISVFQATQIVRERHLGNGKK